ncbi:MAG TPA: putative aminohydrolase SsnA [Bacillota bacterium]|nr:putative aminohydrolase SsnA [Bacillota bacterium]
MLLIGNGRLITRDVNRRIIEDGCVAIKDNVVVEVGLTSDLRLKFPEARFIDARGKLVMPGLINTHTHFYSTFARGISLKDPPPTNFREILSRLWWRLDKALTLDDLYYSAMVTIVDCIKNGVTTVFDHHASPNWVAGSLFRIASATQKAGLRSCLSYEVSDRDGEAIAARGIQENMEFIRHCRQTKDPMLKAIFGLHASLTLSDRTLDRCLEENAGTGVGYHVHAAEGEEDRKDAQTRYGMGVIERLQLRGVLGTKSIAVHCVHISEGEIEILKETGTNVVHNPESNMGNAVGVSPVLKMVERGVILGMGTDGYTSDMMESLKVANCLHKHANRHPSVAWAEPPQMLFENNRIIAGKYFEKPVGQLVPGAYADVIIVDYNPPTPLTPENLESHLLFGVSGRSVETTVINGRVVMEDRKLMTVDEEAIMAKSRELTATVWKRF